MRCTWRTKFGQLPWLPSVTFCRYLDANETVTPWGGRGDLSEVICTNISSCSRLVAGAPDSAVGIATRYGVDGQGSNPVGGEGSEIFRTSPDRSWGLPSLLYKGKAAGAWP